jgi:hypothetical protein
MNLNNNSCEEYLNKHRFLIFNTSYRLASIFFCSCFICSRINIIEPAVPCNIGIPINSIIS